jgi:hypothetical protein
LYYPNQIKWQQACEDLTTKTQREYREWKGQFVSLHGNLG